MNILETLHNEAAEAGVNVRYAYLGDNIKAMCVSIFGVKGIGINRSAIETPEEERMVLIHELTHLELDLLYKFPFNGDSPEQKAERRRIEAKVNRKAIERAIPIKDLQRCIDKGMREIWEFAAELCFENRDIEYAINHYMSKGELAPTLSHD